MSYEAQDDCTGIVRSPGRKNLVPHSRKVPGRDVSARRAGIFLDQLWCGGIGPGRANSGHFEGGHYSFRFAVSVAVRRSALHLSADPKMIPAQAIRSYTPAGLPQKMQRWVFS